MRLMLMLMQCIIFSLIPMFVQGQDSTSLNKAKHETEFQMRPGTYLGFGQVNLSMGEIGFKVEVTNAQKSEPRLEFRIDKPRGKIIGTLKIPYTGDTTYALKVPASLGRAYGTHDLYLVAKGSGQFIISSFTFIYTY